MLSIPSDFTLLQDGDGATDTSCPPLHLWFRGNELLVDESLVNTADAGISGTRPNSIVVGRWGSRLITAHSMSEDATTPPRTRWVGLRSLFGVMSDDLVAIAGRASQLVIWDRTHQFCGVCAAPTVRDTQDRSRRCPSCGHASYPRISPAMMCLVTRGQQILLARNVNFPAGRYSALAGFLEAGESVEDAVHREVREEVGIEVGTPRYFGSQSWPFPNSLMIAYTAEYESGELKPNGHEIAEADWFDCNNLPSLPPRISIARALIDSTLACLRDS